MQASFCSWNGERLAVTVSVGVFGGRLEPGDGWDQLIHAADQALYRAKQNGRNRVEWGVTAPPDAWTVNPNDRSNAMARTLRQGLIGCSTPQQLSTAERANCREDAMRRGLNAAPITG